MKPCQRNLCFPGGTEWPERSAFETAFGITFLEESEIDPCRTYDFRTRVVPAAWRYGLRDDLSGKSVAVVGNGTVRGCGKEIDSHDEVIRISSMRRWSGDACEDGARITMWAGQLAFVVSGVSIDEKFSAIVARGTKLWALSPFHITCDAYTFLEHWHARPDLLVLPSASCLRDVFREYMSSEDVETLFEIAPACRHVVGMTRYELLLTGTRLVLGLEASGVGRLSLYGFDLFTSTSDPLWFGHDVDVDRRVLLGVKRRFGAAGRGFCWHNEPSLA